jgi:hypothetical protein
MTARRVTTTPRRGMTLVDLTTVLPGMRRATTAPRGPMQPARLTPLAQTAAEASVADIAAQAPNAATIKIALRIIFLPL